MLKIILSITIFCCASIGNIAYGIKNPSGVQNSIVSPPQLPAIKENKQLMDHLIAYGDCLNRYYQNIESNQPNAIQIMMGELSTISHKIILESQSLEVAEMEMVTKYLSEYDEYIQQKVNDFYAQEIQNLEKAIQENEAQKLEIENE